MGKLLNFVLLFLFIITGGFLYLYYRDIVQNNGKSVISGCTPYAIEIMNVTSNSAQLKWKTSDNCIGFVKYNEEADNIDLMATEEGGSNKTSEHIVNLFDLKPGTTYYIVITSEGKSFGYDGLPLMMSTRIF